jgi:hypothetical protein
LFGGVVDEHVDPAEPIHGLLDGRGEAELSLGMLARRDGLEAERDVIADTAGNLAILGHAGNRSEAHARHAADNIQDGRNDLDAADGSNVFFKTSFMFHSETVDVLPPAP